MVIPAQTVGGSPVARGEWARLDLEAKRQRLLSAASEVFARKGLEAPMSDVAEAAGAGVASVYRRFPSKRDLLAALVVRRLDQITRAADEALREEGDRWPALTGMLRRLVDRQAADDFLGDARVAVNGYPEVIDATARAHTALESLLAQARSEGRLRRDATTLDLRLLFSATRAAKQAEPEHWPRMLELLIDALDTHPSLH